MIPHQSEFLDPDARQAFAAHVERRLLHALGPGVGSPVIRILGAALRCIPGRPSVDAVSAALGTNYRSLGRELALIGGPSPAALLGWARLFYATALLEESASSVEHAAALAGFESGAALRHLYRRHAGVRPLEIHERGGLEYLTQLFRHQILAPVHERRYARLRDTSSTKVHANAAQKVQL